jgi:hypothetical protein
MHLDPIRLHAKVLIETCDLLKLQLHAEIVISRGRAEHLDDQLRIRKKALALSLVNTLAAIQCHVRVKSGPRGADPNACGRPSTLSSNTASTFFSNVAISGYSRESGWRP